MAAQVCLNNEFMEDEKYHISWDGSKTNIRLNGKLFIYSLREIIIIWQITFLKVKNMQKYLSRAFLVGCVEA